MGHTYIWFSVDESLRGLRTILPNEIDMEALLLFHVWIFRHFPHDNAVRCYISLKSADILDTQRRQLLLAVEIILSWVLCRNATIYPPFMVQFLQRRTPFKFGLDDL